MAAIYVRQGELELARATYQRVVTEHAQSPEAGAARTALSKLTAPAAVAPPQTSSLESLFRGFNTRPDVSPDGLLVAGGRLIGSPTRQTAALDVRAVASGAQRTLVEGLEGFVRTVRFSPDGSRLAAYVIQLLPGAAPPTSAQSISRVSLVVASAHVKTGLPINLPIWEGPRSDEAHFVEQLPWSPNGQWLPYPSNRSGKSEAFLLDARSGKARPLGVALDGAPDFLWSPDGQELAVRVGNGAIQIVTIGTGVSRTVAVQSAASATTRLGAWPSAGAIAITQLLEGANPGTTEVSLVSVADGSLTPICKGFPMLSGTDAGLATFGGTVDLCFGFSGDGRTELIWRHENKRLVQRDVAAGTERPLVSGFAEERGASISRDGRLVVFFSNRDARWGLYAARLEASAPTTPVRIAALDDLPTGARVLWTDTAVLAQLTQNDAQVFRVQMDPATGRSVGELLQLTQESTYNITPTVSNDGKQIAFFSRRGGFTYPAVMNADGSGAERTLPPSVLSIHAHALALNEASADRRSADEMPASQQVPAESSQYSIRPPESGRPPSSMRPSYPGERGSWAVDSAREEIIVATGPEKGPGPIEFRARSMATSTDRLLATIESPAAPLDHFVVSKDGTQIAYFLSTYFSNVNPCAPCELGVINLTTGLRRQLPNPKAPTIPVAWSPDGRFLLYGAPRPRVMNVESGESWTLMEPAQQPAWTQSGSWAPDGSFLVLSATTQRGEWKLWKDVTVDGLAKAGRR